MKKSSILLLILSWIEKLFSLENFYTTKVLFCLSFLPPRGGGRGGKENLTWMSNFEIYLISLFEEEKFCEVCAWGFISKFCFLLFMKCWTEFVWKVLKVNLRKLHVSQINKSAQKFYCVLFWRENLGTEINEDVWLCLLERAFIQKSSKTHFKLLRRIQPKMRNFLLIKTHIIHLHFIEISSLTHSQSLLLLRFPSRSRHEKLI